MTSFPLLSLTAGQKELPRRNPESLLAQGDLVEAKAEIEKSLRQTPDDAKSRLLLTKILLLEDQFDQAKDQIQRVLKQAPRLADALTLHGHCLFREGDFRQAENEYRKSLSLDSQQAGAHMGLGRLHLTKLQTAQSIEAFQKSIELAPDEPDHYFFASEAYGAAKDPAKQIASLDKYLSLKPQFGKERVRNAQALLTFFRSLEGLSLSTIAHPARSYEIPFQPFFGLMLVEGHVNGEGPFRFLVDSGATSTVISNALLDQLKIPALATATVSCVGGSGKTSTQLAKVDRFKVGELEITNLPVATFDNTIFAELIDGVLSTADLADFLITLDYPDRKILLEPQKTDTNAAANRVTAPGLEAGFRILGNLILLPVTINKQTETRNFLFDTGAVASALSKRQAAFLGVHEDTPNAKVDLEFAGACGVTQSVLSVDRVDLKLQTMTTPYAKILAVELKEISKELRTEVSGILGGDFYSKRKVVIDYKRTRLVIE